MTYIYGDIVILENFIMNYIIIWLTARYSRKKIKQFKIIIGSLIGAIYTILLYIPFSNYFGKVSMKICLSILMIVVVFTPRKVMEFIKPFTVFYLISFIFGGSAFALIYMTNRGGISEKGLFYISDFPVSLLVIACVIGYFTIKISLEYIQRKISKDNILTKIFIDIDGRKKELIGLFDTANFLQDPISKLPVIVVEYDFIQDILPIEIKGIFHNKLEKDFEQISKTLVQSNWINRFRMIPFSSLGEQNGMLVGFKTDRIGIIGKKETQEVLNVIMAVYNHKLSKNGEYNALLHPEILNIQS